jgi:hypothetical protein
MPLPVRLADAEPAFDPLGEGTGGDRPRVGAKAPAVVPKARLRRDGGGRALPVLCTGGAERRHSGRVPRSFHTL